VEGLKEDLDATFDLDDLIGRLNSACEGGGAPASEVQEKEEEPQMDETVVEEVPSADQFTEETPSADQIAEEAQEDSGHLNFVEPEINQGAIDALKEAGFDQDIIDQLEADKAGSPAQAEEPKPDLQPEVKAEEKPIEKVEQKEQKPAAKKTEKKAKKEIDESIRVKLDRIDKINNVIGELVILQTVVSQRRYQYIQDDLSNKSIGSMGKLFKEVQELAMSLRMLPLKGTFQKMTRIVRDTSDALGKNVKLHMLGEETEVDKTVLEKLGDPLVHIIRNAVDHGVESPEDREAAGKDPIGNVELKATHEGSNLVIQVTDDGKGIDHEALFKKAVDKKIVSPNANMTPNEIVQLIFHAGFSMKEKVTEVSGRGVGMDVVKTNIESLGGEVKLASKIGEGSSLKIILPLTLAIIEGIVINAEDEKFVLPLSQVYEIIQVKDEEVQEFSGVSKLFKLRGEVLPLFWVNKKVGHKVKESNRHTVIIVRGLQHAFGVVVDDILYQQQVVIKKLGADARGKKGIMGSAIMADGMPSIILDLFELFKDDVKSNKNFKKLMEDSRESA
jgi:two-component system chemotaxis sensor kinase CheA